MGWMSVSSAPSVEKPRRPFRTTLAGIVLTIAAVALSGCAETEFIANTTKVLSDLGRTPVAPGRYKVGKPYQIKGVWYYPKEDWSYVETGIASWYGPNFHGKQTANGEIFDQNAITAAHKTLPMPTAARVTNLENGRSLVVRVNDRGPFVHGRIIDLSRRSAQLLGFERQGTARVRIEILPGESRRLISETGTAIPRDLASISGGGITPVRFAPRPAAAAPVAPAPAAAPRASVSVSSIGGATSGPVVETPSTRPSTGRSAIDLARNGSIEGEVVQGTPEPSRLFVQAGAFGDVGNAERLQQRLDDVGPVRISETTRAGRVLYRVRLGPFAVVASADEALREVIDRGYPGARIIAD